MIRQTVALPASSYFSTTIMTLCLMTACAGSPAKHWEDLDYSSVYRAAEKRQIDSGYTQPSIVGCIDDDLYNCK